MESLGLDSLQQGFKLTGNSAVAETHGKVKGEIGKSKGRDGKRAPSRGGNVKSWNVYGRLTATDGLLGEGASTLSRPA